MDVSDFARFGRLHPLVLHLPIGLLFGLLLLEVFAARGQLARRGLALVLWLAALAAVVTAASGWVLSHEEGYGGAELERHERLGIAVAVLAVLAALLHDASARSQVRLQLYRLCLGAACVVLLPTGHLGSVLTRGADWLDGPKAPAPSVEKHDAAPGAGTTEAGTSPEPGPAAAESSSDSKPDTYATVIAPLFAARCVGCHGPTKHKASLHLDSPEGMLAGGVSGPALVPGNAQESLLLVRVSLPLEHEDHMPPEGKPQPTQAELATLAAWIRAGAPFTGHVELGVELPAPGTPGPEGKGSGSGAPALPDGGDRKVGARETIPSTPAEALAALDRAFVHHELLRPGQSALWVDVAPVARTFGDAEVHALLVPLAADIEELSLARSQVTDAALAELARFPRLARLDLGQTAVTDAGLRALAGHPALADLVLARTKLGPGAVAALRELPKLARVALWQAGLTPEALAELRSARPELEVNDGEPPAEPVLEVEPEPVFTSDRPQPGAEGVPPELTPVNQKCPVSGSPVNPKYSVVSGARVIGFCCPNCPKDYWAAPEKYADKLP